MINKFLLFAFCSVLVAPLTLKAQEANEKAIDQRLAREAPPSNLIQFKKRINYLNCEIVRLFELSRSGDVPKDVDYDDSIAAVNYELSSYLEVNLPRLPQTMTARASGFGVDVNASPDGRVREWEWDTHLGGTMPHYNQILEYKTPSAIRVHQGSITKGSDMDNSWYQKIYSVRRSDGSVIYIPLQGWKGDSRTFGQIISAFTIADTGLVTVIPIFQTRKALLNEINLNFPEDLGKYESHNITLRDGGQKLLVPLVTAKDRMTGKYLCYQFDGDHYVYSGVAK